MCINRMCKRGLYYELHSTAYLHISFISLVDMESTSSGTHGVGGLEAMQGFIQLSIAGTSWGGGGIKRYALVLS